MNARENPFATHHTHELPFVFDGPDWDVLMGRLYALQYRAAIVGPHGSGKTTLLEQLGARLESQGFAVHWHKLYDNEPRLNGDAVRKLGPTDALLLDSAELLGSWQWLRLRRATRNAGALLITAHRHGRLPTLMECRTTPSLLRDIANRIAPGAVSLHESQRLFAKHEGNIRNALRDLYDQYAARSA